MKRRDLTKALALGGLTATAMAAGSRQSNAQTPAKSRLAQILERGSVRIGTTGDFNPMSFRDPGSNEYKGFDIAAMTELAKDMGVKIEWVVTEWAQLVAGISANRFDIFSGASVNMARARTAAFTLPYLEAGTVPLSLKANAQKFKTWDSINAAGVKVSLRTVSISPSTLAVSARVRGVEDRSSPCPAART